MTTLALIAAACIWFAAGYITAELVRVVRRIANLDRAESTLADGDELLCINATVFRERTGEIAWWDNEKPPEHIKGG